MATTNSVNDLAFMIGRACAEVFAERGTGLVLLDKNRQTLPRIADAIASRGVKVIAGVIDLTHTGPLQKLIEDIQKEVGIDILVNNAGFDRPGVSAKIGEGDFNDVLSIHLGVPFFLAKILLPDMRPRVRSNQTSASRSPFFNLAVSGNERSDLVALYCSSDISLVLEIKDNYWQIIFTAKTEGCRICNS